MDQLNHYLEQLIAKSAQELHLMPNTNPFVVSTAGNTDIGNVPLQGSQISMMVFPLIPAEVKQELPNQPSVQFVHPSDIGEFDFTVQKSAAGFNVTITPRSSGVQSASDAAPTVAESPEPMASRLEPDSSFPAIDLQPIEDLNESPAQDMFGGNNNTAPFFEDHTDSVHNAVSFSNSAPAFGELTVEDLLESAQEYVPPVSEQPSDLPAGELIKNPVEDRRSAERTGPNSEMQARLEVIFRAMAEAGASDLHLSVGTSPTVRKDGRLQRLECGEGPFTESLLKDLLHSIMPEPNKAEYLVRRDSDFVYEMQGFARFRSNVFLDRKGMGAHFRLIPLVPPTAEQLSLPNPVVELSSLTAGLVVVAGAAGSGRSSTLCALLNQINSSRNAHIITIEDPIEFVHENAKSIINQRQVHSHTPSFNDALRAAAREDPDVIMISEIGDVDVTTAALSVAGSGRLVFAAMHAPSAAAAVDRLVHQFPAERQQQVLVMLSESLKGVITQTLVPRKTGGCVVAFELLSVTPEIQGIIREGDTAQLTTAMHNANPPGMSTIDTALLELVQKGIVEPRDAHSKAVDKMEFEAMLSRGGIKS